MSANEGSLELAWEFRLKNERNVRVRCPVLANGIVYVAFFYDKHGFSDSTLFAFDAETGTEKWTNTINHVGNKPVVAANGVAYWSSFEGNVYAIDGSGAVLWKAPGTRWNIWIPTLLGEGRILVPEIHGGSRSAWCLSRETGKTIWEFEHGGDTDGICLRDDQVFLSTSAHKVRFDDPPKCTIYCLSALDGSVVWSHTEREQLWGPDLVAGNVWVYTTRNARVLSADRGKLVTELPIRPEGVALYRSSDPTCYFLWDTAVLSANRIGSKKRLLGGTTPAVSQLWRINESRKLCEAPSFISPERIAYLTQDGNLCIIEASTGTRISETTLKTKPSDFGGIAASRDQLVVTHGRDAFSFKIK